MAPRILKREKVAMLSRLSLFENCTKRELDQIASICVEARRPAGTILTREGREGGLMFIIVEGKADVVSDGKLINKMGPGDVVGELALIDGKARSATVTATTEVHLLEIAVDEFQKLVKDSPGFVRNLLRALSARIRDTDERWPAALA